ncbi:hypothetical protein PHYPSEUDO_011722 [Phytophthora pseudosyringae]|uniref:Uncharacterized protein n=1 Tax=Phytophthora pseudosyringae TaxID=221518 RepID=A0A8T1W847_9STRA|nr:hypothetical protein PHYPSEUDO_011722 [Phytophthora pseudosyringae]
MENDDVAGSEGTRPDCHLGDQLFSVVYDPRFDRFFLEDEAVYRGRSRTLERKAVSVPWEKWILPPKSPPKRDQPGHVKPADEGSAIDFIPPPIQDADAVVDVKNDTLTGNAGPDNIPALDFSSFQQPLAEVLGQNPESIPVVANKQKKARVQNYTVHFKRTNRDVAKVMAAGVATAEPNDTHEVKWNGEVLRVQLPGLRPETEITPVAESGTPDALQRELLHGSAEEQWLGSTYDLKSLMRIRAHADGLRGVNAANRFVAVSSSESSESEEEVKTPPKEASEAANELMPVFFRDDRVLFHAKRRWFTGTVWRRIPQSDFYNIRADNGSRFEAVLASKMELLDEPEELPFYHYTKGDKVIWKPDGNATTDTTPARRSRRRRRHSNNSDEDELTYKAKILQVRSLYRFDLLLRTDRVVKKVPYEQLRPRDASEFVSTATSRRR